MLYKEKSIAFMFGRGKEKHTRMPVVQPTFQSMPRDPNAPAIHDFDDILASRNLPKGNKSSEIR